MTLKFLNGYWVIFSGTQAVVSLTSYAIAIEAMLDIQAIMARANAA